MGGKRPSVCVDGSGMVISDVYTVLLVSCIDCDFSCHPFSYSVYTCFGDRKPGLDSFSRQSEFACGAGRSAICVSFQGQDGFSRGQ